MKNDKSQFVVPTSDFYLSLVIGHLRENPCQAAKNFTLLVQRHRGFSVRLRVLRVSYTMKLEFLARLERFFTPRFPLGYPGCARILRAGRQTLRARWKRALPGTEPPRAPR